MLIILWSLWCAAQRCCDVHDMVRMVLYWMLMILWSVTMQWCLWYDGVYRKRRRIAAALLPRLFGNNFPGHTTRAPPVGFEVGTYGFQFFAIANLDKTSLLWCLTCLCCDDTHRPAAPKGALFLAAFILFSFKRFFCGFLLPRHVARPSF